MDKLLIKRGSKRALEQLDPLQVGELFLAKDEERLYVGGPKGNISIPSQQEVDEKATKTELQQISLAYKESYDTLDDLKKAYPNGDVYNHVVLADGMIYTYANGEWISTGVEANGAIEFMKAYEDLKVLEIGGRNYARELGGDNYNINRVFSEDRKYTTIATVDGKLWLKQSGSATFRIASIPIEPNTTYTWSFNVYKTGSERQISVYQWDGGSYDRKNYTIGNPPVRIKHTFTSRSNSTSEILHLSNLGTSDEWYFSDFKLEKGNKATDWTPAPEDIDAHPFVAELAETVFRSKQNEERIRNLENTITALGGDS